MPVLRSRYLDNKVGHRLPRNDFFYRKRVKILRVLQIISHPAIMSAGDRSRRLHRDVTKEEGRFLWPWAPRMKSLNKKIPLTWLVLGNALWVCMRLFVSELAISSEYVRCGDFEKYIEPALFHCGVIQLLCKFVEDFLVCRLHGKFCLLQCCSADG